MERRAANGCRSRRPAPLPTNPPAKRRWESELASAKPCLNFQGKEVGKGYPPPPAPGPTTPPKISCWNSLTVCRQSMPPFGSFPAAVGGRLPVPLVWQPLPTWEGLEAALALLFLATSQVWPAPNVAAALV